jgi:hypothetical protein
MPSLNARIDAAERAISDTRCPDCAARRPRVIYYSDPAPAPAIEPEPCPTCGRDERITILVQYTNLLQEQHHA